MFSGASADWGRKPILRASALGRVRATSWPSKRTAPSAGESSRTKERRSVDLPQALAPTTAVKAPSGTSKVSAVEITRSP